MDKAAIKTFAIEARNQLIADVRYLAEGLGITKDTVISAEKPAPDTEKITLASGEVVTLHGTEIRQRNSLLARTQEVGFDQVIEEVAYTWFNRLIAVRFMEVHEYLPIRVLSSSSGKEESDLIAQAPDLDFGFTSEQVSSIYELKDKNKIDELFKILFIKQCNVLNDALPGMFQKTEDYTEILFPLQYTNPNGVIRKLLTSITEDDFGSVEIIGWMYQYYNSELKDDTFARLKKNQKITKERIPSATQLFTPEWIVRYMVENSLGRLWYEGHPDDSLKSTWKYYLDEAKQEPEVEAELQKIRKERALLTPEDITFIDPCMGSGHILVYAFDVLMQIYESAGFQRSDAARLILEKNLYGLDIDDRAGQLAYFAVMMKAREYNRKIFSEHIAPHLCSIQESNIISDDLLSQIANGDTALYQSLVRLRNTFIDAKEYGSILNVPDGIDFNAIKVRLTEVGSKGFARFDTGFNRLVDVINQGMALSQKYDAVVTNPPYMGAKGMNKKLLSYLKNNFDDYKSDMFSVSILQFIQLTKKDGFLGFMAPFVWMFIQSYEKLRIYIYNNLAIESLIQLEYSAFEEATVPICTFTLKNSNLSEKGNYIQLTDFRGGMDIQREKALVAIKNRSSCHYLYTICQDDFLKLPGFPIGYWVSEKFRSTFTKGKALNEIASLKAGLATGDNSLFQRLWFEVNYLKIGFNFDSVEKTKNSEYTWYPCNSGGEFRKWANKNEYLVNWKNDGYDIRNFKDENGKIRSRPQNTSYYFKKGITWNKISSSNFGVRYKEIGYIFDDTSRSMFLEDNEQIYYLLGLLCSCVTAYYLKLFNPTMSFTNYDVERIPFIYSSENINKINSLVEKNINLTKKDSDSFEISWDFQQHPFIIHKGSTVKESFENWQSFTEQQFNKLKSNEEELNRIFIEIYGLQDELTPEEEDKDVSIRKADLQREMKSFLSYAVGCMFGRYSLDIPGLVFAGGDFDPSMYKSFPADDDGIIPITDREYFEDDIVGRFIKFLKVTYGESTLEENLSFIAEALKTKGATPRESIRNYFLKDFYADHLKIYQKRPIYWLFDSGKENGFKALIYLHRYTKDTVGRVRTDYLHETQKKIEAAMQRAEYFKTNGTVVQQRKATDEINTLTKQLEETKKYDEALATIALQRIELDLDDGVKVNYEKFQNVDVGGDGKMKKTVDLLGKIK